MQNEEPGAPARPTLDEDTIAFAGRVFQYARLGHHAELGELLGMGLPPDLRNDKGDTLLMLAAYHGHAETVRVLLEHRADPEIANDRGQTPLAAAAFKGAMPVVQALLEGGAAIDGAGPDGRTALMIAAMFNRVEMVELLLARGADPVRRDAAGHDAESAARAMSAPDTPDLLARAAAAGQKG
ncbi:ankyrin repeat domain-containing protein [Methylobacterium nonmethylotrophicum]|uniref:Ankyrin repeat domain-containing protein n=1 Tax=Methylobacterium nonmethylotrophicum TaxID=1141884 RepID=A0A4Z0NUV4_9HYPH|nr:ankyrin repeat domain-containing protein [Methylobacterium nonmethylotrophicum]TGE00686.1 ankyrin repeat domain-containing protein [Methylobacterium nonmethylotrophicum]